MAIIDAKARHPGDIRLSASMAPTWPRCVLPSASIQYSADVVSSGVRPYADRSSSCHGTTRTLAGNRRLAHLATEVQKAQSPSKSMTSCTPRVYGRQFRQNAAVHETAQDLERLQALLDRSRAQAGAHLKGIFEGSGMYRQLSAEDLAGRLTGVRHVALATVTSRGEPRVAPTDGLFFRGTFHVGLPGNSFRLRHLKARPSVAATHFVGEEIAVWMHGHAELMQEDHPDFGGIDGYWTEIYGSSALGLGPDIYYVRLEPDRMFAYEGRS